MHTLLWFVVILLALDAVLIAVHLLGMLPTIASSLDIGSFLVLAGVLTALTAFLINLSRARSDDILKTATDLLEKAYETLASNDGSSEPTNRRLSWLSAARLVTTRDLRSP